MVKCFRIEFKDIDKDQTFVVIVIHCCKIDLGAKVDDDFPASIWDRTNRRIGEMCVAD